MTSTLKFSALLCLSTVVVSCEKPSWLLNWNQYADASSPVMSPGDMQQPHGCNDVVCDCKPNADMKQVKQMVKTAVKCQDPVIDDLLKRVEDYASNEQGSSAVMFGMTGTGKTFLVETLGRALFSHSQVTQRSHQAACCARKNSIQEKIDVSGSCVFQVTAADMNSRKTRRQALGKLADFERAHSRGIVLLDEVNSWHDFQDITGVLLPRLENPGRRLVISGANLPESSQLNAAIAPMKESGELNQAASDYPEVSVWCEHQSESKAIKKYKNSPRMLQKLCDPNFATASYVRAQQRSMLEYLLETEAAVVLARKKRRKVCVEGTEEEWCNVPEYLESVIHTTLQNTVRIVQNVPSSIVVMMPISKECAREAVKDKVMQHVDWLMSDRVVGGPIFHKVTVKNQVLDQIAEHVIEDATISPDQYLAINDPEELEEDELSPCWTIQGKNKKKKKKRKGGRKNGLSVYSNLLKSGLRRLSDNVENGLRVILDRSSLATLPKRGQTAIEKGDITLQDPHSADALKWSKTYGPKLLRPGKKLLQFMSKCRGGLFGSSHEKCYPTWAMDAEVQLDRNHEGEITGVKLGSIKKWHGAAGGNSEL